MLVFLVSLISMPSLRFLSIVAFARVFPRGRGVFILMHELEAELDSLTEEVEQLFIADVISPDKV